MHRLEIPSVEIQPSRLLLKLLTARSKYKIKESSIVESEWEMNTAGEKREQSRYQEIGG